MVEQQGQSHLVYVLGYRIFTDGNGEPAINGLPGQIRSIGSGMLLKHLLWFLIVLELDRLQITDGFAEFSLKPFPFVLFLLGTIVAIPGEGDAFNCECYWFDKYRLFFEQMLVLGAGNRPPEARECRFNNRNILRCRHYEWHLLLRQYCQIGTRAKIPVHDERGTGYSPHLESFQGIFQGRHVNDAARI